MLKKISGAKRLTTNHRKPVACTLPLISKRNYIGMQCIMEH